MKPFQEKTRKNPRAVLVVSGTNSGVGKTTVTVGLMAAFSQRGHVVQAFKTGPDFLDGMHHEAAIRVGECEWRKQQKGQHQGKQEQKQQDGNRLFKTTCSEEEESTPRERYAQRRCVNLDGWMMGSAAAVFSSFERHSQGADICIIEGAMGLHDSRDGTSDEGSAAQIAKLLNAPVVLVIDGSMMARSVAAMALGYAMFDPKMRLGAVVANKVGGSVHIQWIAEALELEGVNGRLIDVGTNRPTLFAGALPNDSSASIPERHLGLTMPAEQSKSCDNSDRFVRLAAAVEDNLNLDEMLRLGQSCSITSLPIERPQPILKPFPESTLCRIAVALDEAFCFYYMDNLHLLRAAGAQLVPFSPLNSPHLPPSLDAIYIGGGYPELHAKKLEDNKTLREDIASYSNAGGAIFAECGGLMYLSTELLVNKSEEPRKMCGVFPITTRMTPHAKMYYAEIKFTHKNTLFPTGGYCRGQKFHFSEVIEDLEGSTNTNDIKSPILVTPQLPKALPEQAGFVNQNSIASYFHLHFASYRDRSSSSTVADHFVENAIKHSPHRKAYAVSFVTAATEIIYALNMESSLVGVTSICDFPSEAKLAPRQIVCRSPIDAASMTSAEVNEAISKLKSARLNNSDGPPQHWIIDSEALQDIKPQIIFVQNTCEICDPALDDVLYALNKCGLNTTVQVRVAPTTLAGVYDSIRDIAKALDVEDRGIDLVCSLKLRMKIVKDKVARIKTPRPSVLSLEGLAPLCTGGNWLPDLKYEAGCIDALGERGGCPARILSWDEILKVDPDILMISPCSANPTRTLNELHLLASSPEFWKLRCVQKGCVYIVDHGCFSRPGPRLVEGVEMMAVLFRNISAPSNSYYRKWEDDVLKYQCSSKSEQNCTHCTTELSMRFKPCFNDFKCDDPKPLVRKERENESLRFCNVTRCTIPGFPLPLNRSAHCTVSIHRKENKNASMLLIGGEHECADRLNDIWELHPPSKGWDSASAWNKNTQAPSLGNNSTWEYHLCGKVAGENVPTRRSNHAAAACGEHVLVFGGWGVDNVTPLTNCELLHIESLCWTHCSTRGLLEPSPRGNPTLVYIENINIALLFGGWNGVHALSDLWKLDMDIWEWKKINQNKSWPSPRTDHSAVLWETQKQDSMLVFGGNVEGQGPCSQLWELRISKGAGERKNNVAKSKESYAWHIINVPGPNPPARTSHTAEIVTSGKVSKMIIVGGTNSSLGSGRGSMLCDAWVLNLGERESKCLSWLKLDWGIDGLDRCRHSMSTIDGTVIIFGGFDGEVTINEAVGVWQGNLKVASEKKLEVTEIEKPRRVKERWEAEVPVRVEDLPPNILAKANRSKLPGAVYKALHRHAVAKNRDTYIDPSSGYSVFSQVYLKRRPCCGNGCRHCPHGHSAVPGKSTSVQQRATSLDW